MLCCSTNKHYLPTLDENNECHIFNSVVHYVFFCEKYANNNLKPKRNKKYLTTCQQLFSYGYLDSEYKVDA
jgi:hypothetical protein